MVDFALLMNQDEVKKMPMLEQLRNVTNFLAYEQSVQLKIQCKTHFLCLLLKTSIHPVCQKYMTLMETVFDANARQIYFL